jgi:hypothetical protein
MRRFPVPRTVPGSLAADLRLEDVLEPVLDLLVGLVHFLVGQRAVERLVRQGVGEALLSGRDALALVQVEKPHAGQQVAAGEFEDEVASGEGLRRLADDGEVDAFVDLSGRAAERLAVVAVREAEIPRRR